MKIVMKMKNVAQDGVGNERKHFRPQMRHRRSHPQNKNCPFASIPPVEKKKAPFSMEYDQVGYQNDRLDDLLIWISSNVNVGEWADNQCGIGPNSF